MALLTSPKPSGGHHHLNHAEKTFKWDNTLPTVSSATHWRLKIGSAPFGYNYYFGGKVPFGQRYDSNVTLNVTKKCYATIEWSTDNGSTWSVPMRYDIFYCKP